MPFWQNSNRNDLWALGCTLYQMLSGTSPFKDASEWLIFQRIIARDIRFPNYFSEEARDIIDRLLVSYNILILEFVSSMKLFFSTLFHSFNYFFYCLLTCVLLHLLIKWMHIPSSNELRSLWWNLLKNEYKKRIQFTQWHVGYDLKDRGPNADMGCDWGKKACDHELCFLLMLCTIISFHGLACRALVLMLN